MIETSLTNVIVLYLMVTLAPVAVLWTFQVIRRRHRDKKRRKFHIVCGICGVPFDDRSTNPLPKCPHCGSLNERNPVSNL